MVIRMMTVVLAVAAAVVGEVIQFFIHLRAELNSQWPVTGSARMQTAIIQHKSQIINKNIKKSMAQN
jgi:hypothetical protein